MMKDRQFVSNNCQQTHTNRESFKLNPKRIVDPQTREQLGISPIIDKKLLRTPKTATARADVNAITFSAPSVVCLTRPTHNSSNVVYKRKKNIENSRFDPVSAVANLLLNEGSGGSNGDGEIRRINDAVTLKASNYKKDERLFSGLTPIYTKTTPSSSTTLQKKVLHEQTDPALTKNAPTSSSENHSAKLVINRAKKTVNKDWLKSLDMKPRYDTFLENINQMDTISLPFPTTLDQYSQRLLRQSSSGVATKQFENSAKLSISSPGLNFEDATRWREYSNCEGGLDVNEFS